MRLPLALSDLLKQGSTALVFGMLSALGLTATAAPSSVTVTYSEIVSDPTGVVPGALGPGGVPVVTNWLTIAELAVSHDGSEWVIKGSTTQGAANDSILVKRSGVSGTMFAQDGQPLQGGVADEQYDFFDMPNPVSWNDLGDLAFSCRAKGGVAGVAEKLITVIGSVHSVVLKQGDPALGLIDAPANTTGDELFAHVMNSVHYLNDGTCGFICTPITNCSGTRYPAFFRSNTSFIQSGVTQIEGEDWDSFDVQAGGGTPDGNHWFIIGETERLDTTTDFILAVDDAVIARENTPLGATGITVGDGEPILFCRMLANGDYFARGYDTLGNDWAIRGNGSKWAVIAKTGDPITTPLSGPTESWGSEFDAWNGNTNGDWVLAGNTNNPDVNIDNVLVLNGEEVIAREGDAIDLNGNGMPDDNVFIATFQPNDLFITNGMMVHVLVTLRNGAGAFLGNAYLQIDVNPVPPSCLADVAGPKGPDGIVNTPDLLNVINAWGPCGSCPPYCPQDFDLSCGINTPDLLNIINNWGPCPN